MKTERQKILEILEAMHPSEAIALLASIGKHLRKKNAARIYNSIKKVARWTSK